MMQRPRELVGGVTGGNCWWVVDRCFVSSRGHQADQPDVRPSPSSMQAHAGASGKQRFFPTPCSMTCGAHSARGPRWQRADPTVRWPQRPAGGGSQQIHQQAEAQEGD